MAEDAKVVEDAKTLLSNREAIEKGLAEVANELDSLIDGAESTKKLSAETKEAVKALFEKLPGTVVEALEQTTQGVDGAMEISLKDPGALSLSVLEKIAEAKDSTVYTKAEGGVERLVQELLADEKVVKNAFEGVEEGTLGKIADKFSEVLKEAGVEVGFFKRVGNFMARPFMSEPIKYESIEGTKLFKEVSVEMGAMKRAGGIAARAAIVGVPLYVAVRALFGGKSEPEAPSYAAANENYRTVQPEAQPVEYDNPARERGSFAADVDASRAASFAELAR